LKSVILHH